MYLLKKNSILIEIFFNFLLLNTFSNKEYLSNKAFSRFITLFFINITLAQVLQYILSASLPKDISLEGFKGVDH